METRFYYLTVVAEISWAYLKLFSCYDALQVSQTCGHRRRSSVNFGRARHFCPNIMCKKLTKFPNFTWYLPEKLSKFLKFYDICRKKWHDPQKFIFKNIVGGELITGQIPTHKHTYHFTSFTWYLPENRALYMIIAAKIFPFSPPTPPAPSPMPMHVAHEDIMCSLQQLA